MYDLDGIWNDEVITSKLTQMFAMYEMSKNTYLSEGVLEGLNQGLPIVFERVNATVLELTVEPIGVVFVTETEQKGHIFLDSDMDYCMNVL